MIVLFSGNLSDQDLTSNDKVDITDQEIDSYDIWHREEKVQFCYEQ